MDRRQSNRIYFTNALKIFNEPNKINKFPCEQIYLGSTPCLSSIFEQKKTKNAPQATVIVTKMPSHEKINIIKAKLNGAWAQKLIRLGSFSSAG